MMNEYILLLKRSVLFKEIKHDEMESLLGCLSATLAEYKKGDCIFHVGDYISSVAMVVSGAVHIQREDYWGNQSILTEISQGEIFGETYACLPNTPVAVNAVSVSNSKILFFDVKRILMVCSASCPFHTKLISNLISVIAFKNLMLTEKLQHMAQRTTGDKLLSYLSDCSRKATNSYFEIPFNRQQLADYLSVDRSAMSSELGKLKNAGILDFNKNCFRLYKK